MLELHTGFLELQEINRSSGFGIQSRPIITSTTQLRTSGAPSMSNQRFFDWKWNPET